MKIMSAICGIVFALVGILSGLLCLIIDQFIIPTVDGYLVGQMITLLNAAWLFRVLGLGLGVVLIGISNLLKEPKA